MESCKAFMGDQKDFLKAGVAKVVASGKKERYEVCYMVGMKMGDKYP
jgi:hypothetical protein